MAETAEQQQGDPYYENEEDGPEIPEVAAPVLDRSGKTSQRTVEQKKKQEELVKVDRRLKGTSTTFPLWHGRPTDPSPGLETNRSRSSSRRNRRKRVEKDQRDGKYMHTNSLTALEEADANNEMNGMQPFERIGPDSTSMDGPVTMARAERGEIPVRGSNPGQPYYMKPPEKAKGKLDETDGLKLSLEANLDIEIELKASIRGDLTLSLL